MRETSAENILGRAATVDEPGQTGASTNLRSVGHQVDRDIIATAILHIPARPGAKGWGEYLVRRSNDTTARQVIKDVEAQ